jgi:hypothetical protein
MTGQIFISYRREESRWSARSLYDRLSAHFDRKQIFMDIDAISLGDDFVKAIEKTVAECDVLIAVIGAHWLTSTNEQDVRRLDNPEDFVRREIATALKRDIRVIPVLVDGALMPRPSELPDDLKPLVRRNALRISDTGFDDDCRRLVAAIEQVMDKTASKQDERERKAPPERQVQPPPDSPLLPSKRKLLWALPTFVICLVVGAGIYFVSRHSEPTPTKPEVAVQPSVKPTAPVPVETPNPATIATPSVAAASSPMSTSEQIPNPELAYVGKEAYVANGQQWVRYNLKVVNWSAYPQYLFTAAPQLPPCGNNHNASRTWVDIYDATSGTKIYGFCGFGSANELRQLWFAVAAGGNPPASVYVELKDRLMQQKYKSNAVAVRDHS